MQFQNLIFIRYIECLQIRTTKITVRGKWTKIIRHTLYQKKHKTQVKYMFLNNHKNSSKLMTDSWLILDMVGRTWEEGGAMSWWSLCRRRTSLTYCRVDTLSHFNISSFSSYWIKILTWTCYKYMFMDFYFIILHI